MFTKKTFFRFFLVRIEIMPNFAQNMDNINLIVE